MKKYITIVITLLVIGTSITWRFDLLRKPVETIDSLIELQNQYTSQAQ